jgi:hypothetical protein
MNPVIYIDDTGTPEKSNSKYDPGNWKTWVAMLLHPNEKEELSEILIELQKILKKRLEHQRISFYGDFFRD